MALKTWQNPEHKKSDPLSVLTLVCKTFTKKRFQLQLQGNRPFAILIYQ